MSTSALDAMSLEEYARGQDARITRARKDDDYMEGIRYGEEMAVFGRIRKQADDAVKTKGWWADFLRWYWASHRLRSYLDGLLMLIFILGILSPLLWLTTSAVLVNQKVFGTPSSTAPASSSATATPTAVPAVPPASPSSTLPYSYVLTVASYVTVGLMLLRGFTSQNRSRSSYLFRLTRGQKSPLVAHFQDAAASTFGANNPEMLAENAQIEHDVMAPLLVKQAADEAVAVFDATRDKELALHKEKEGIVEEAEGDKEDMQKRITALEEDALAWREVMKVLRAGGGILFRSSDPLSDTSSAILATAIDEQAGSQIVWHTTRPDLPSPSSSICVSVPGGKFLSFDSRSVTATMLERSMREQRLGQKARKDTRRAVRKAFQDLYDQKMKQW